jgi:hypothetical protein
MSFILLSTRRRLLELMQQAIKRDEEETLAEL